jgi:tRNA (mo5U34)-methyltransferase
VAELEWYHTLELAPGVVTPGWFDLRAVASAVPLPERLAGWRALDVGTFDGFWAFLMERRGAAEVVAVDLLDPERWDWPAGSTADAVDAIGARKARGAGFELAHDALGSAVTRLERSVYELDPEELGRFDVIYVGSLLLHLRDPVGALARVVSVSRGVVVIVDAVDPLLTRLFPRRPTATLDGVGRPWWWKPNAAALVRMAEAAGLVVTGRPALLRLPAGAGQPAPPLRTAVSRAGMAAWSRARRGDPHAALLAALPPAER